MTPDSGCPATPCELRVSRDGLRYELVKPCAFHALEREIAGLRVMLDAANKRVIELERWGPSSSFEGLSASGEQIAARDRIIATLTLRAQAAEAKLAAIRERATVYSFRPNAPNRDALMDELASIGNGP